jgi:hypothetical protein
VLPEGVPREVVGVRQARGGPCELRFSLTAPEPRRDRKRDRERDVRCDQSRDQKCDQSRDLAGRCGRVPDHGPTTAPTMQAGTVSVAVSEPRITRPRAATELELVMSGLAG